MWSAAYTQDWNLRRTLLQCFGLSEVRCRAISVLTDPISRCTLSKLESSVICIEWSNQFLQCARVKNSFGAEIRLRRWYARCEKVLLVVKLFGWLS